MTYIIVEITAFNIIGDSSYFCIGVIPNHFNQSFYMTLSELDETWYVSSTCGFVKPDKVSRLVALWLPS